MGAVDLRKNDGCARDCRIACTLSTGEALVFRVSPTKILAFTEGDFAQTANRFSDREAV